MQHLRGGIFLKVDVHTLDTSLDIKKMCIPNNRNSLQFSNLFCDKYQFDSQAIYGLTCIGNLN